MSEPSSKFASGLRVLGRVRPGEAGIVALLSLNAMLALIAYYVLKVVREPLILNTGGAEAKTYAAAIQALTLAIAVPLYSRLLRRVEPERLLGRVVLFFLICVELFYAGAQLRVPYLGFVFFVWVGIFSLAIVAQFWSFANDLFDTDAGERLFPIIAFGAACGSIFGAFLARRLIALGLGPPSLLQVAALLLIAHMGLYALILRRTGRLVRRSAGPSDAPLAQRAASGISLVLRQPYLRRIALLLVALNLVNTIGEYILSAIVKGEAEHALVLAEAVTPQLDRAVFLDTYVGVFYADFFTFVNVATLLLQGVVASRLVARFGIAGVLFALPLVAGAGYAAIALGAGLALTRLVKVAENSTDYSIMNTARAMLWLPTSRIEKYAGKQAVDTLFVRLGYVISAGLIGLVTHAAPHLVPAGLALPRVFASLNLLVIAGWLWLAFELSRRYERMAGEAAAEAPAPNAATA